MTPDQEEMWLQDEDIRALLQLAAPVIGQRRLGLFFVAYAETLLRSQPAAGRSTAFLPMVRAALDEEASRAGAFQAAREREQVETEHLVRQYDATRDAIRAGHRGRNPVPAQVDALLAAEFLAEALNDSDYRWWSEVDDEGPEGGDFAGIEFQRDCVIGDHIPHLRDIAGNPFRPVAFDTAWRTEAVVGLARGMYEARDFAPMPVLADALEDAGCADPDILAHCRTPGLHVRGCWVVDLVLGKP